MMLTLLMAAVLPLNGLWDFHLEADKSLEETAMPAFQADDRMLVPGCWDVATKYFNRRGTGCYRRTFDLAEDAANAFLVVEGCALRARFWVDGREIGFSKLPWSRLEFPTGALKAGRHELVAALDSVVDNEKVKLFWNFYDFYAHGGFYHGVKLETLASEQEIRKVAVRTRDYRTGRIELEAIYAFDGPADFTAAVSFDGKPAQEVAFKNRRAEMTVPDFKPWSPASPNLHTVTLLQSNNPNNQTIKQCSARFGIRQVSTEKGRILLNGEPIYLKGVNRHESHIECGSATPKQLMYEDLMNVRDLGGNFVRGAHYPQCEEFLDLCDELGILVWEESLGWGNKKEQLEDPEFCALQEEQTRMMVRTSINHPSIIISGFLNEPMSDLECCRTLVDRLADVVHAEDSGHLVTFACYRYLADISNDKTDIIAYNVYPCTQWAWPFKTGSADEMRANVRTAHAEILKYFRGKYGADKPIIVSETGTHADYGARDPQGRAQLTEDYQEEFERVSLEEIFANPEIAGVALWQQNDSKTYVRTHNAMGREYGINTGGIYDLYRRPKLAVESVRRLFRSKGN